jgi:hypothetical protein
MIASCELILDCVLYILISTQRLELVVFIDGFVEISLKKMPAISFTTSLFRHFLFFKTLHKH